MVLKAAPNRGKAAGRGTAETGSPKIEPTNNLLSTKGVAAFIQRLSKQNVSFANKPKSINPPAFVKKSGKIAKRNGEFVRSGASVTKEALKELLKAPGFGFTLVYVAPKTDGTGKKGISGVVVILTLLKSLVSASKVNEPLAVPRSANNQLPSVHSTGMAFAETGMNATIQTESIDSFDSIFIISP